jgi:hypothetical protein
VTPLESPARGFDEVQPVCTFALLLMVLDVFNKINDGLLAYT